MNSPVADTSAIGAQPVAVWLFPPGNRAYYLPRAVVHVLIADIEVTALEEAIGWVDVPAEYATEDFVGTSRMIPADKPFFAYETYRAIIRQAKLSVLVVDRYARAASVLPLLTANPVREIRMLVDKDDLDLATRSAHFAKQYEVSVEVRRIKPYPIHDRFLVLDGRHVWHLGASLNTLNKSSLVRLLEASSSEEVRDMLETAWANATSVQPAT